MKRLRLADLEREGKSADMENEMLDLFSYSPDEPKRDSAAAALEELDLEAYFDFSSVLGVEPAKVSQQKEEFVAFSSLQYALQLNRAYQEALRDYFTKVEHELAQCQHLRKTVLYPLKQKLAATGKTHDSSFLDSLSPTALQVIEELRPSPSTNRALSSYCELLSRPRWTRDDEAALEGGVQQQNRKILFDRLLIGFQQTGEYSPEESYRKAAVELAESAMVQEQLRVNIHGIDWDKLSAMFLPGRTADECRLHWTTVLHPLISHAPFSAEEEKKLTELVQELRSDENPWLQIAQAISPSRTAWQCAQQHIKGMEKSNHKRNWTNEEDTLLRDAVRRFGSGPCRWDLVSEALEWRRTPMQCHHRWSKSLDPDRSAGRWTSDEDAWLLAAIRRHYPHELENVNDDQEERKIAINWSVIQEYVPRRTDVQCRERFCNVLSHSINRTRFTPEEDARLVAAIKELGEGKWSQLATRFPGRTDNQCRRRWMSLQRNHKGRQIIKSSDSQN